MNETILWLLITYLVIRVCVPDIIDFVKWLLAYFASRKRQTKVI